MDLSFLDKSSAVMPLLVRLYDSQRLTSLAKDAQPQSRTELLTAVSELLEMELSPRESELIADVLIGLMRQAELDIRQALAERLAITENAPLRLILQLANDEIDVAGCILRQSVVLGDLDLIYIIKSKGPTYWQAIAEREAMSHQVMNMLADTHDFDTALTLANNEHIRLSEHTLTVLSDIAQKSDELAVPLLRRDEVSADIAKRLYKFVGEEVKVMITAEYNIGTSSVTDALDDVMIELIEATEAANEFAPTISMLKAADRYKEKGLLTTKLMLGALRRGQIQSFIAQYARYTGLAPKTVLEILSQPSGQGLAVACKAFELGKEDFVSIYLLTNRIRNHGRMVDLKDMTKAINYFNRIKTEVARGIIKNSLDEELKK
jgi:uncharacterized protein (DUF2336 family)